MASDLPWGTGYVTSGLAVEAITEPIILSPSSSRYLCPNSVYKATLRGARESNSSRRPDGSRAFESGGLGACPWILSRCAWVRADPAFRIVSGISRAGGYHHHIGLNTWESDGGQPPASGTTGLYHLAILYPTRAELRDAVRRLQKAGIPLEGASDDGVSEALYLRDPDGNGVELYWDRPQ